MKDSPASSSVLEAIVASNRDRKPKRVRLKLARMDAGPFAFFRGSADRFARDWRELKPPDAGPALLLCGDLHLENFGAFRAIDGGTYFDINDFDEALVAPCALDLARCAASILLAAEEWRLTPLEATGLVLAFLDRYEETATSVALNRADDLDAPRLGPGAIWDMLGETALGTQRRLLDHLTERSRSGRHRTIRRDPRHPALGPKRTEAIREAVELYGKATATPDVYRVRDVSARVAGIGSLGLRRYVALIAGGGAAGQERLLDIKEARPSALLACTDAPQPETNGNEALRVVEAQRTLQAPPALGLDTIAIDGEWYRMRELVPDENRASLDRLQKKPRRLLDAIETAARITGRSHRRGCHAVDDPDRADALSRWIAGPALDSVLASAARYAERTRRDYDRFHRELAEPGALDRAFGTKGR